MRPGVRRQQDRKATARLVFARQNETGREPVGTEANQLHHGHDRRWLDE
jgi:hypothetical protein